MTAMTRTALVIHSDDNYRRMIGDALVMFRPGYRVSTASDLATASDWLNAMTPDLIVIEGSITGPDELDAWASVQAIDPARVIALGPTDAQIGAQASAIVAQPVSVPNLLSAVHATIDRHMTHTQSATTSQDDNTT